MYSFIVNPNARSGLGIRLWRQLESILKERKIPYRQYLTRYPGHGTEFAREITTSEKNPTLIVLGGDGTINEVVNGILDLSAVTLGYIPIGSSNDFARSMKLSKDPVTALNRILSGSETTYIDVGRLTFRGQSKRFIVSSGIGFDADICFHNTSSRPKRILNKLKLGKLSYTAIALYLILGLKPHPMTITLDGEQKLTFQKVYFATAMNQRYEGGGFRFCPKADPEDGILDILVISDMSRLKILGLLPTAFKGLHVHFKGVHTYTCKTADIISDIPLPVHADGEPAVTETEITFALEPQKLKLICS